MRDQFREFALRTCVMTSCAAAALVVLPLGVTAWPGTGLSGVGLSGAAQAQEAAAPEALRRISVTGTGRVEMAPDMAMVRIGVSHRDAVAATALQQTSDAVAAMLERLAGLGVESRDIQTSGLALHPVWQNQPDAQGLPVPAGFEASNMVSLRLRDLAALGTVLDALVADGANRLDGVSFGLQDPEAAMDEARRRAVADGARKAALYAGAAGVGLGPLVSLSDGGGGGARPMMMEMSAMRADSVPVAAGELEIGASVQMIFGIE